MSMALTILDVTTRNPTRILSFERPMITYPENLRHHEDDGMDGFPGLGRWWDPWVLSLWKSVFSLAGQGLRTQVSSEGGRESCSFLFLELVRLSLFSFFLSLSGSFFSSSVGLLLVLSFREANQHQRVLLLTYLKRMRNQARINSGWPNHPCLWILVSDNIDDNETFMAFREWIVFEMKLSGKFGWENWIV